MATQPQRLARLSFGPFEIDTSAGELRKGGVRVRLTGQPFQILLILLARPGEVVTREQLHERIWRDGTFVDFEHGLSAAMNKLRRALGDSAENPRYIETVPGRGYRFIGSVQTEITPEQPKRPLIQIPTGCTEPVAKPGSQRIWMATGAAMGGVFVVCLVIWMALQRPAGLPIQIQQLTTNSAENPVSHSLISPDGKYLAYADAAGIKIRLIRTGESHLLPRPELVSADDAWFPSAWFPDGTRILANSITSTAVLSWTIPIVGGKAARVRDNALIQSISPDGSLIAFTAGGEATSAANTNNEIWLMGPRGENARRVIHGDRATYFDCVRWSPDGNRIAYLRFRNDSPDHSLTKVFADYTLESSDLDGNSRTIILSNQHSRIHSERHLDSFSWVPHGRLIYTVRESEANSRDTNLREISVESKTGKPGASPQRVTNLAGFEVESLSVTADGKRLLFENLSDQCHVYVGRLLPGGKVETPRRLTLDERHNSPYAWTPDSKAVVFRSDRTGIGSIYKQALDENEPDLIPTGSEVVEIIRVSPDGKWLVYQALPKVQSSSPSVSVHIMRVPLAGGGPEMIFETSGADVDLDCAHRPGGQCLESERSADGNAFVFYSFDPIEGKRHKLFEIGMPVDKSLNPMLSPDGSRIALTGADTQGRIEIRSLAGHIESTIEVKAWPKPLSIDWAADGKALFVSHPGLTGSPSGPIGTTLLRVDLQGHAQPIWETRGGRYTWAIASPDGKYLAIRAPATERNAWLLENF